MQTRITHGKGPNERQRPLCPRLLEEPRAHRIAISRLFGHANFVTAMPDRYCCRVNLGTAPRLPVWQLPSYHRPARDNGLS